MIIKSLKIENRQYDVKFEINEFFRLTLLVGVSGTGKTQILNSIIDLIKISKGKFKNGLSWEISFETIKKENYLWKGTYQIIENYDFELDDDDERKNEDEEIKRKINEENKPKIEFEQLFKGNELIIDRDINSIKFVNKPMPKLSSTQSIVYILKEEPIIQSVHNAFSKIVFRDNSNERIGFKLSEKPLSKLKAKFKSIEEIKNCDIDIRTKLYLAYENQPELFNQIKQRYIDVFPQIQDIKIVPVEDTNLPIFIVDRLSMVQLKEDFVKDWIKEDKISSGMLKSLIHISELYLLSEGSVILIDEFENSLGINCIDFLTEDLVFENSRIQFIATSHHPYVINNIPYEYWKIVTRKGGIIKICDAKDYNLGKSKQQAFIQLTKILENK